ncbi:MAG: hypothetical protein KC505_00650 [Myxococcales bacterium]|nr:hypothetical protein [Myxococcales bacterium]USN51458.1 MAG: hypothetical protein H6731_03355 [Myxococcales bacterium]
MKKTISLAALAVSASNSFALLAPLPANYDYKNYCLSVYHRNDNSALAGNCDETANNQTLNRTLQENGCADGQISITTFKRPDQERFPIEIGSCLPPNAVQL